MVPILPVDVYQGGSPFYAAAGIGQPGGTARADGALGGTPFAPILTGIDSTALTQIDAVVSQLLQSIGGSAEDDKLLRMLIGLIILLALLENSQDEAASAQNALLSLGSGSQQPQSIDLYWSSTTIAIEQTTTTILFQTAETHAAASAGEQLDARGDQIDVPA